MIALTEKSQLVIIDMQEKLSSAMPKEVINKIIKRCELLITVANELNISQICTEQYPKGLGPTLNSMKPFLSEAKFVEKNVFACTDEPIFLRYLIKTRPQIFLMGMEAHICVLQTALGLIKSGKEVFINGKAFVSEVSVDEQRHYAQDGGATAEDIAKIVTPKKTYSFLADGVLLNVK